MTLRAMTTQPLSYSVVHATDNCPTLIDYETHVSMVP